MCAGLVLLLPEPMSSDGDALSDNGTLVCAQSPHRHQDQRWANGAALDAPDSCDDEDDDDDGDDDSSGGSGQAIAASRRTPANHNDVSNLLLVDSDTLTVRPLDAHSLRGPPQNDQTSPYAEDDGHGDDDDPSPEHSVQLPPASSCDARLRRAADFLNASSIRLSELSLRAPPL